MNSIYGVHVVKLFRLVDSKQNTPLDHVRLFSHPHPYRVAMIYRRDFSMRIDYSFYPETRERIDLVDNGLSSEFRVYACYYVISTFGQAMDRIITNESEVMLHSISRKIKRQPCVDI